MPTVIESDVQLLHMRVTFGCPYTFGHIVYLAIKKILMYLLENKAILSLIHCKYR